MRREPPESLDALLKAGEGLRVEFKRRLPRERRFARLLASLANAGGGTILLGVDDDGSVRGLPEAEAVVREIEALAALLLEPPPPLEFSCGTSAGEQVLVARVSPAPQTVRLVFEDTPAYARVNDRNLAIGKTPPSAVRPHRARLGLLEEPVRRRFNRVRRAAHRFTVQEYAKGCNISERQARRDIVSLLNAFLVVEVEGGLLEVLDE